jgi:acetyl esterase/lipase
MIIRILKKFLFAIPVCSLLLTMQFVFADEELIYPFDERIQLWPHRKLYEDHRQYLERKDDITYVMKDTRPSLEIYKPKKKLNNSTAVVILPGGAYVKLVYDYEGTEIAKWLNELGYTAIILRYTVPGSGDGARLDIQRAFGIVRGNAARLGFHSNQIGVIGFSAGGHLAVQLSSSGETRDYEVIDEWDKNSIKPNFIALIYPAYLSKPDNAEIAEGIIVNANTPSTFIIHTENDPKYIQGSKVYSKALEENKVESETHIFEDGGHGFGLRSNPELPLSNWPQLFHEWVKKTLKK